MIVLHAEPVAARLGRGKNVVRWVHIHFVIKDSRGRICRELIHDEWILSNGWLAAADRCCSGSYSNQFLYVHVGRPRLCKGNYAGRVEIWVLDWIVEMTLSLRQVTRPLYRDY